MNMFNLLCAKKQKKPLYNNNNNNKQCKQVNDHIDWKSLIESKYNLLVCLCLRICTCAYSTCSF